MPRVTGWVPTLPGGGRLQRQQGPGAAPDLSPGRCPEYVRHREVPAGAAQRPGGAWWGQRLGGDGWMVGILKKRGNFRGKHGEITRKHGEFSPQKVISTI